jgi:hypothetical protein
MLPVFSRARQGWRVLAASAVQVAHTGNTAETALATITVPGGAMGANGILRITTLWSHTNGADNKLLRVRFSGAAGTTYLAITATTTATMRNQCQIANRNAANSQVGGAAAVTFGFGASSGAVVTSAVNTAADATIVITGQLGNAADNVNLESYLVELLYRP